MAEDKFYNYIDSIPPVWKGITIVGTMAVIIGVGYITYTGMTKKKKDKEALKKANETIASTDSTLQALSVNNIHPSFTITQYKSWADELEACFQGWGTCTTWNHIFNSLNNQADVVMLIQQYGIRKINAGTGVNWFVEPVAGTLSAHLNDELSAVDLTNLKMSMRKKGINFDI